MLSQRHEKISYKTSGFKDTSKKYSLKLSLPLASKIEALSKMHPQKKRTDLIVDLIDLGLAQVEHAASHPSAEPPIFHPDTKQAIYLLNGPFAEFHGLIHKHHLAMEREIDEDDTDLLYPVDEHSLGRW
ncbi:MAG: hypothetical protein Q7J77_09005 [Undibacterium sp.]|jgi:hypothetical protein|nr:hypothetical protein [Undibacterium sp.]